MPGRREVTGGAGTATGLPGGRDAGRRPGVPRRPRRFGRRSLVLVERGAPEAPQRALAERLAEATGWELVGVGAAGFGPAEVAERVSLVGGARPSLVVGPDLLRVPELALRAGSATAGLPWPVLSVRAAPGWLPRILVLWTRGRRQRELAEAARAVSEALGGLTFAVEIGADSARRPESGATLEHRGWLPERRRRLAPGPALTGELRTLIQVFGPDVILTDPRFLPDLARCAPSGPLPAAPGRSPVPELGGAASA